jgi:hypothetical protein
MTDRLSRGLFGLHEEMWYRNLGERMRLLGDLYAASKSHADSAFVERITRVAIANFDRIGTVNLLSAIEVMGQPWMTGWRSHRTVMSDLLLRKLSDPEDINDWKYLTDAMDVITVTNEFHAEVVKQFEHFIADLIDTGQSMLDDDPEDFAQDPFAEELRDLHELAYRWDTTSSELDDLIDFLDDNAG